MKKVLLVASLLLCGVVNAQYCYVAPGGVVICSNPDGSWGH